jgi:hypothetical protein
LLLRQSLEDSLVNNKLWQYQDARYNVKNCKTSLFTTIDQQQVKGDREIVQAAIHPVSGHFRLLNTDSQAVEQSFLSALTCYILWGFLSSFAYMNRLLEARFFFTIRHVKKKIMRWRPRDFGSHSNGARRPIQIGNSYSKKTKPQPWSPKWDETLSYRQIALPVSMRL